MSGNVVDLASHRRKESLLARVATDRGADGLALVDPAAEGEPSRVGVQGRDDDGHELLLVMTPEAARSLARFLLITADAAERR